jgi:adenine-specific DNA-methyltransferase
MVEGRYLTGRDYAAGFEENVEYLRLDFLDPIDVQLGLCAEALAPTLWLMAGAIGDREPLDPAAAYHLPANAPYAIVIEPSGVAELVGRLADRPDVRRVFIVAGSDDAYAAVAERLPEGIETTLLYRAYLDACRRVGESTR